MVEVVGAHTDHLCENVFWFRDRSELGPPLPEGIIAANVLTWYNGQLLPLLSEHYNTTEAKSTPQDTSGEITSSVTSIATGGGIGGPVQPANVSYRVNLEVAQPPGRRRGCIFIPGIPTGVCVGNRVIEDWRAALIDVFANLIDLASIWRLRWVVASKFHDNAPRAAVLPLRVDFIDTDNDILCQRRSRLKADHIIV